MTKNCSFNWPEMCRTVGPYIRPGGAALTGRALEICNLPAGSRIADIGCGAGGTLEYLERVGDYRLTGLDCSEELLEEAALRLDSARLVLGRADVLPFSEDSFDALFCECVLSVLDDRMAALREYARVLKDGGYLIVSDVFTPGSPDRERVGEETRHLHSRRLPAQDDLLALLADCGFSVILWEEHKKALREFAVRMILADHPLPDAWGCCQDGMAANRAELSYYLLVARK